VLRGTRQIRANRGGSHDIFERALPLPEFLVVRNGSARIFARGSGNGIDQLAIRHGRTNGTRNWPIRRR